MYAVEITNKIIQLPHNLCTYLTTMFNITQITHLFEKENVSIHKLNCA